MDCCALFFGCGFAVELFEHSAGLHDVRDRLDWRERHDKRNFDLSISLAPPVPYLSRGLAQSPFGFCRRGSYKRIVGPGMFGVAATEFFFYFEIG